MRYSVPPRNRIFVKVYGFLSFAKNMSKNIGKSISKILSVKYSQKFPDHAKQGATDAFKTASKRAIQELQNELVIWLVIKLLIKPRNYQEVHRKITEHDKEIPEEIYISRRKAEHYWWSKIIMDYQKSINLLDNTPIQPSKFWKKNWIEIIDKSRGTYGTDNQVKVSLCNYSNTYILADITIADISAEGTAANNVNKKVVFKNCAPFINCLSITNNTHVDDAHDIGAVMLMYNLIEYINNFFKKN